MERKKIGLSFVLAIVLIVGGFFLFSRVSKDKSTVSPKDLKNLKEVSQTIEGIKKEIKEIRSTLPTHQDSAVDQIPEKTGSSTEEQEVKVGKVSPPSFPQGVTGTLNVQVTITTGEELKKLICGLSSSKAEGKKRFKPNAACPPCLPSNPSSVSSPPLPSPEKLKTEASQTTFPETVGAEKGSAPLPKVTTFREREVVDYSTSCVQEVDHLVSVDDKGRVHIPLGLRCANFVPAGVDKPAYLVGDIPGAPWLSRSKAYPMEINENELVSEKGVAQKIKGKRFTVVQYQDHEIVWAAYSGISAPEVGANPDDSKYLILK